MNIWLSPLGSYADNSLVGVKENPKDTKHTISIPGTEKGGSSSLRQQMRIEVVGVRYESLEQSVCPIMAKGSTTKDSLL